LRFLQLTIYFLYYFNLPIILRYNFFQKKIKLISWGEDPYNLSQRFGKSIALFPEEWHRIAYGGLSDAELEERRKIREEKQRELDMETIKHSIISGETPLELGEAPVVLKKGGKIIFNLPGIELQEYRKERIRGTYGGVSFRVMKGVYLRTGSFGAGESKEELKAVDIGNLIMTNKKIVFMGSRKSASINLAKIIGIEAYENALVIHAENRKKPVILSGLDKLKLEMSVEDRAYEIPLTGIFLKELIEGVMRELPS